MEARPKLGHAKITIAVFYDCELTVKGHGIIFEVLPEKTL